MAPEPSTSARAADAGLPRLLGAMSIFTMLMTLPQIVTIWTQRQASGVSVLTWSAYLVSAVLWLWYGLRKGDRTLYLPCIGWIVLDLAVIAGALRYA